MAKEFLGVGWKFPVKVDSRGNIAMSAYEEDIREAILIILKTAKGERLMRPDFGCGIHELVFSPINTATITLIEKSVREAITEWEPRVEILSIDVSTEEVDTGKLLISIEYRVRRTNNRFNLVYPFYLKEA
ncbi:MAG: baseplate protein [Chloroflexi bacterium]|nr:MAG: baseplate protein [Chloroflexota bacterium]